jgi:hypothetical protein
MKRREFITLIGSTAAAWPIATRAQQPARLPLVAILRSEVAGDPEGLRNSAALVQGLQGMDARQGRNVRIEQRWAGGSVDAMKALAKEPVIVLNQSLQLSQGRHLCRKFGWLRIERLAPGEHANCLIVTPRISGEDIDRFPPTLTNRAIGREGWTSSEYRRRKLPRRLGKNRPRPTSAVIMTIARGIGRQRSNVVEIET